ncbi:MAG: allantoate deiminase [Solirubrobacteraceae bacterium]|nr:allantoate deiminase [Solirubrobacteraceae bacterium]
MGMSRDPAAALDGARIAARLDALWQTSRSPAGGADRAAYSAAEADGMRLVAAWAAEAGLEPAVDRHGNLWALPPGGGPLVTSGSHVDTVPGGGRYDGALGTVLALEAAIALRAGTPGGARAAVLVCAAEEAPRFGAGTVGSRALTGAIDEADLAGMTHAGGVTAAAARDAFLADLAGLPRLDDPPLGRVRAHVEVHIEPRHELRARGAGLGVVERIAAPHRHEITVVGRAGHAGEVPMRDRQDALGAAAELVLALEAAGREVAADAPETVATTGVLVVSPGAVSVIPARVTATMEVRGTDAAAIARVEAALEDACAAVGARRGVRVTRRLLRGGAPIALDPALSRAALDAARRRGIAAVETYSGAGHDAGHLAAVTAAALLFVPLAGGESHSPDEAADAADVLAAGRVLVDVLGAA